MRYIRGIVSLRAAFTLRLDQADLSIPLNYLGDAVVFLTKAKGIIQGDWIRHNSRVGMPLGADLIDFPLNLSLDSFGMLITSMFTDNPGILVNVQWLGGLALASAAMTYSLMRFKIGPRIAICLGIVYALQPYGFYRGISHLHSMYYIVPLLATGGVELALGAFGRGSADRYGSFSRIPGYLWVACIGIGLSYLYLPFRLLRIRYRGSSSVLDTSRSQRYSDCCCANWIDRRRCPGGYGAVGHVLGEARTTRAWTSSMRRKQRFTG